MAKHSGNLFSPFAWFDHRSKCFVIGGVKLKGVKPWLKARFFPDYSIKSASKLGKKSSSLKKDKKTKQVKKGAKAVTGVKRGMTVDYQIKAWVEGRTLRSAEHVYTRKFRSYCEKNEWIPIVAQMAVGSLEKRVGTAIDVIVQEKKTKKYIALEIKCGHEDYFETSTGKMKSPLENIDNSALNQAFLQLTTSMHIHASNMENSKRKMNLKTGKVIQITEKGIAEYPLPDWCSTFWKHLNTVM